jgi:hypothetical protein
MTEKEKQAFLRHLEALGLTSSGAYRDWCRGHQLDDAIKKHWRERRRELLLAKRLAEAASEEQSLKEHLTAMGMETTASYRTWCKDHGFNAKLQKSDYQRVQERRALGQQKIQARRQGGLAHTRSGKLFQRLFNGEVPDGELSHTYLATIQSAFNSCHQDGEPDVAAAYLNLLKTVEGRANFFSEEPVVGHLGPVAGNTYVEGLYALARYQGDWIRELEKWDPTSHEPLHQFGSLARYLLCQYPVPDFMNSAWFKGCGDQAKQQQNWYLAIGNGQNVRSLDVPIPFSKMMAHRFIEAPEDFSIESALRWGELMGMGAGEDLVHAMVATRLGEWFVDIEFWRSVFYFFINNPMLDTAYVIPIVDFIYNQRYVAPEIVQPDGSVVTGEIPERDFTMKGRTVESMLTLVESWHGKLGKPARNKTDLVAWNRTNVEEFEHSDEAHRELWHITELLNEQELTEEGARMHHCVRTYTDSCRKGDTSVWSVKSTDTKTGRVQRVLTVALRRNHSISQIRGVRNIQPEDSGSTRRSQSAAVRKHYRLLKKGRAVLKMWIETEGLTVLKQT